MKKNFIFIVLLAALLRSAFLTPAYGTTNNKYNMVGVSDEIVGSAIAGDDLTTKGEISDNHVLPESSSPVETDDASTAKEDDSDRPESIGITLIASLLSGLVVAILPLLAQKREKQREILLKNAYEWYKQIKTDFLSDDFLRPYFNTQDMKEKFKKKYEASALKWEDAEFTLRADYFCNKILDTITPEKMLQSCSQKSVEESQKQIKVYVRDQYKKLLKSIMR